MAQVVDTETVNNFTINRVPSQAVFDSMLANDQVNENELYIVEGDYVPEPATATPLVESGSGAVGTSDKFAREDHVHPARTISSNEVIDNSDVGGANVQASLETLKGSLNSVCLRAAVTTISGNGTSSNTLTGLTADHVVGNWGMFSDSACTTPIPENSPTCDITITTAANAWSVTIANFSSTFYLRPTFILKQN